MTSSSAADSESAITAMSGFRPAANQVARRASMHAVAWDADLEGTKAECPSALPRDQAIGAGDLCLLPSRPTAWSVATSKRLRGVAMSSVARVTEITAESEIGFEDAIKVGISRANETLRGVRSAWIKEQSVKIDDGVVTSYRVDMLVTFLLEG